MLFDLLAQYVSIVFAHDFNPVLTPGLHEDSVLLAPAYALMDLLHN